MLISSDGSLTGRYTFPVNATMKPTKESGAATRKWEDDSNVVWSEVIGLCGFWVASCRNFVCGAGTLIKIFTQTLGLATIHKKCGLCPALIPSMLKSGAVRC